VKEVGGAAGIQEKKWFLQRMFLPAQWRGDRAKKGRRKGKRKIILCSPVRTPTKEGTAGVSQDETFGARREWGTEANTGEGTVQRHEVRSPINDA